MTKLVHIAIIVVLIFSSCGHNGQNVNIKDVSEDYNINRQIEMGEITDSTVIYLRGSFNNWGTETPFTKIGNGIYVIENIMLINGRDGMKIASEDWSTVDIGGNGKNIKHNVKYGVKVGGNNLFIEGLDDKQTMHFDRITLDINKKTLLMTKAVKSHPHICLNYIDGTEFMTDELELTSTFNLDVSNGIIKVINNDKQKTFVVSNNTKISIGKDEPFNTTFTVVTIANASDGVTVTDTVHYTKTEPTGVYVYFSNPTEWEQPYCYLWNLRGDQNYPWPGEAMTWDANKTIKGKRGWWKIQASSKYSDFGEVIFNNNGTLQTNDDLSMDGTSMCYDGTTWQAVEK